MNYNGTLLRTITRRARGSFNGSGAAAWPHHWLATAASFQDELKQQNLQTSVMRLDTDLRRIKSEEIMEMYHAGQ